MSRIYLVQKDGNLSPLEEQRYDSEDLLQTLLERYPDLLAGDQMRGTEGRRWLLVSREVGVPGEDQGGDRWSVDHLFLDQDATPTLVEVKRSTDTRIRREVVGQMLDYAANAVQYWPAERIRSKFEAACEARGDDPTQLVADLVVSEPESEDDVESFWDHVKTNLQAGRIRLVFVADDIPAELRRIVEFLNEQMDPAEVLAVEVRQFVGEGLQTLVPKVIGQTAAAQRKKATSDAGEQWTEERFMQALQERSGQEGVAVARSLLHWLKPLVTRVWWGRGKALGSFVPVVGERNVPSVRKFYAFAVWTNGTVEVYFQHIQKKPPFDSVELRQELRTKLNEIPGISLPEESIGRRPTFSIAALSDPTSMRLFQEAIAWALDLAKKAQAGS